MDDEWRPYEGAVIFVDPSGRGKDEIAWAVMKCLNGLLYLLKVGAEVSDPTKAMVEIATDARRFGVHMIEVEPNFGQGMWVAAYAADRLASMRSRLPHRENYSGAAETGVGRVASMRPRLLHRGELDPSLVTVSSNPSLQ
jgi:hypothetical protein